MPPPLRRSSSLGSQSSSLLRFLLLAFLMFITTTYLVFSLDVIMLNEDEESTTLMPRRRTETIRPNEVIVKLRSNRVIGDSTIVVMEEDDQSLEMLASEKSKAESELSNRRNKNVFREKMTLAPEPSDDDFAEGLNSIGLALQNAETIAPNSDTMEVSEGEEPPQPEEEEEEEESSPSNSISAVLLPPNSETSKNLEQYGRLGSGKSEIILSTDWKRLHTCKYGRSEKTPVLAYGTWIWRHRKGAVMHEEYTRTPSDSKLKHIKTAIHMLSDGVMDLKNVVGAAVDAGYTLCKIDFGSNIVVAWQPRIRGDALIFTRHMTSEEDIPAPLILEVPHTLFDHTLNQALHVFTETRAKALVLSESHRCSRSLPNKCTGNEGEPIRNVCGGNRGAVNHNSDAAHAVQTVFHAVHEQLSEDYPDFLFASLHATKAEEFIISDGTSNPVSSTSPVVLLVQSLAKSLPDRFIGLCNDFPLSKEGISNIISVPNEKRIVCGATNVQGRHLNGLADPCRAKVHRSGVELKASGRFLHIEQPVNLVLPQDSKTTKPIMSKQLSEALLSALQGLIRVN